MMDDDRLRLTLDVLSDLVYDDFGVWEVGWRANEVFSDRSEAERDAIAEAAIDSMLRDGLAVLVDDVGSPNPSAAPPYRRFWRGSEPDVSALLSATPDTRRQYEAMAEPSQGQPKHAKARPANASEA